MKILDIILEKTALKVVIIGDSIAVGLASGFAGAIVDAKVGRSTQAIASAVVGNPNLQGADIAIVSAGTNDYPLANGGKNNNTQSTISNIQNIKNALKAKKYIWILPFNKTAAKDVSSAIGNDASINLSSVSSTQDKLHPTNYNSVIQAVKSQIGNVDSSQQTAEPITPKKENNKLAIAVPNGRVGTAVADIQKALLALGYKLPKHGVDGVRGPETSSAIKQFQTDNGLTVDGDPGVETVGALNKLIVSKGITFAKSTQADVKGKMSGVTDIEDDDIEKLGGIPKDQLTDKARKSAEEYVGRTISDDEWDYLIRATTAESAYNVKSYAMVMASILNRARDYGKNGIIAALKARNQFQAVTGTAADGHKPSPHFVRGPNAKQLHAICAGAIQYLSKVSHNQRNFSATNPAAYGAGTNIGWLHQLQKGGGQEIAGSHFNTKLSA